MIAAVLRFLARHATALLAASVFLGILWPGLATLLAPTLVPVVVAILVTALVRLDWQATVAVLRRPGTTALILLWLLLVSPVLTALVLAPFALPEALVAAVVLMAAAPPIMSSIAFAVILGLDAALATVAVFVSMLLVPLTLPPLALALLGLDLSIGTGELMTRLAALALGAFAIAFVIRRLVPAATLQRNGPQIDGVAVLLLLVFVVAIMDGVNGPLRERPAYVALVLGVSFAANLGLQGAAALAFAWLGRHRAASAAFVSGNRNMALLIGALAGSGQEDVLLYFAVAQVPMYVLPVLLRPLYGRASVTTSARGVRT